VHRAGPIVALRWETTIGRLLLTDRSRIRARMGDACPTLDFYGTCLHPPETTRSAPSATRSAGWVFLPD
jgi:hypothetical protein